MPPLQLPTLLSQVLVAFTIEFDNEFEHRMPHWTTNHGGTHQGPWLVSLVMWSNCMRFVGDDGVRVSELEELARTFTNLHGMQRWGYIVVQPDPSDRRPKPPHSAWLIRATPRGRMAQEVWRPLFDEIEKRWETRFGQDQIGQLRESLRELNQRMSLDLPDCLPILGYGLISQGPAHPPRVPVRSEDAPHLVALLSRVLLAFALEFERASDISLAISANILRVLDEEGVRVRDLPLLSGVSKEAISMALGILQKKRVAEVAPDQTAKRGKIVRLTPKGREAQQAYLNRLAGIEERWQKSFGRDTIGTLRQRLERVVGEPALGQGLEPYPDGWRAKVPKPLTLPHYPMVLHRGGFPDGS